MDALLSSEQVLIKHKGKAQLTIYSQEKCIPSRQRVLCKCPGAQPSSAHPAAQSKAPVARKWAVWAEGNKTSRKRQGFALQLQVLNTMLVAHKEATSVTTVKLFLPPRRHYEGLGQALAVLSRAGGGARQQEFLVEMAEWEKALLSQA